MKKLLNRLRIDHPDIVFVAGKQFYWSPASKQITYAQEALQERVGIWALLHELSHAILGHENYETDFELLMLEVSAWKHAQNLAIKYGHIIDVDHVQDCLDTYRDWLDQRSTCPLCGNTSMQQNSRLYRCFNCASEWQVTASRFCRPYRLTMRQNKKLPVDQTVPQTTFM